MVAVNIDSDQVFRIAEATKAMPGPIIRQNEHTYPVMIGLLSRCGDQRVKADQSCAPRAAATLRHVGAQG
jgi:hypothetical protein